jgi:hypothetical protein
VELQQNQTGAENAASHGASIDIERIKGSEKWQANFQS